MGTNCTQQNQTKWMAFRYQTDQGRGGNRTMWWGSREEGEEGRRREGEEGEGGGVAMEEWLR